MTAQREWFEKDYYKVLGVAPKAEQKDITRAYRKLARQFHPDANSGDAAAEERFKEVSAAYDVVGDPQKRKEYDEVRAMGPAAGGFGAGGPGGFGPGGFNFRTEDLGDLLGGLFRGAGGRRPGPGAGRVAQRGNDLSAELHLSFVDAVKGITTTLQLLSDSPCSTCGGTGSEPGTTPTRCTRCDGRGVLDDNQGFFALTSPCPACRGQGRIVEHPCATCRGSGSERRPRDLRVRIPAGVEDGQTLRLKGRGEPGRLGGPSGDLLVTLHVATHHRFGRKGRDLTLTLPLSYAEAVLGTEVSVPTLDDSRVTLRIPAGTKPGRTFRVRERGVIGESGAGDLLVTVELAVPTNPSAAERRLLEDLAKLEDGSLRQHLAD